MRIDPEELPHWLRVAFIAQCARRMQPMFLKAWPEATPARVEMVERAIALAEKSAIEERVCEGLEDAVADARCTAGRALIPLHYPVPIEDDEQPPTTSEASLIASFAAKVASKAAETAAAHPRESGKKASEAFHFVLSTLHTAGRLGLLELIEADFEAAMGKVPRKRWWQFW